ncbi:hypothetical protein AN217_13895 [Streptomyces qinglanensis]|uniref:Secreted protein n=1 Tax=Streptomyces qinglanensis TaxID=943816 RepID=A0A1E7K484_9ACTN|nr:DUF6167 family protein [Streptomyces qinglanensis]MBE9499480.1 hypothetical protein [Streptomyces sp. GKU 257-1]OEU98730.1 hypothetical protein AN217_13895 [Streptomyces qinglanensis]
MIRRAFWFTTGAAAGVWATTKVQRKIRSLAPDALALRAADKAVEGGHRLREFALDVRAGMAQREGELKDALGLSAAEEADRHRELPAGPAAPLPRQQERTVLRGQAARPPGGALPAQPDHQDHQSTPNHPNDRNEDH